MSLVGFSSHGQGIALGVLDGRGGLGSRHRLKHEGLNP